MSLIMWCWFRSWAVAHLSSSLCATALGLAELSTEVVSVSIWKEKWDVKCFRTAKCSSFMLFVLHCLCSLRKGAWREGKGNPLSHKQDLPSICSISLYSISSSSLADASIFLILHFPWCVAHIYCAAGKYLLMQSGCSSLPCDLGLPCPTAPFGALLWSRQAPVGVLSPGCHNVAL